MLTRVQVHGYLAKCFDDHLKWLLDAASGTMALTQDMLLDVSCRNVMSDAHGPDDFAQMLVDRAACLKLPLVAASCQANAFGDTTQREKDEIRRQLSNFKGLANALDRL
jgi:hypothetical protein